MELKAFLEKGEAVNWGRGRDPMDIKWRTIPNVDRLWDRLVSVAAGRGFRVLDGSSPETPPAYRYAMASTNHKTRDIYINATIPMSMRAYLLAHEIGHTYHGTVTMPKFLSEALKEGELDPRVVPALARAEAIAETTASLVLLAWGVDPNWGYFGNWHLDGEHVREAWETADRAAREIVNIQEEVAA